MFLLQILTFLFFNNPVTLYSYESANYVDKKVEISWKYSQPNEMDYFVIEKSRNGKQFNEFITVKSYPTNLNYFELDYYPPSKTSFYRIKYVAKNGSTSYGNPLVVKQTNTRSNTNFYNLKDLNKRNTLIIFKDKQNNEFYAKLRLNYWQGKLYCEIYNENIKEGTYTIVASDNDAVKGMLLHVAARNYNVVTEQIQSK